MQSVANEQVIAFRWTKHGLDSRISAARWLEAFDGAPMQDSPPGVSLPIALAARVEAGNTSFADLLASAWEAGEFLGCNAMRFAPLFCMPENFAAYTLGGTPDSEEGWAARLSLIGREITAGGMSCTDTMQSTSDTMAELLADGPIPHNDLCLMLRRELPLPLRPMLEGNPYAIQHLLLSACMTGRFLLRPRIGNQRVFALHPSPPENAPAARRLLASLFLRYYAPADYRDFARFAGAKHQGKSGINQSLREAWEDTVNSFCDEVCANGKTKYVLREDLAMLTDAPRAVGLRVVPAYDAYLRQDARALLLPDPVFEKAVFPYAAPPNVVLVDGRIAGVARITKSRPDKLSCACDLFVPLFPDQKDTLHRALEMISEARDFAKIDISVTG